MSDRILTTVRVVIDQHRFQGDSPPWCGPAIRPAGETASGQVPLDRRGNRPTIRQAALSFAPQQAGGDLLRLFGGATAGFGHGQKEIAVIVGNPVPAIRAVDGRPRIFQIICAVAWQVMGDALAPPVPAPVHQPEDRDSGRALGIHHCIGLGLQVDAGIGRAGTIIVQPGPSRRSLSPWIASGLPDFAESGVGASSANLIVVLSMYYPASGRCGGRDPGSEGSKKLTPAC